MATAPIGTIVSAVSACVPAVAPFACRINATRLTASWSLSEPGLLIGIVLRMRVKRSLVGRLRHVFMKLAPASGGASKVPFMSGKWQRRTGRLVNGAPGVGLLGGEGAGPRGLLRGGECEGDARATAIAPQITNLRTFLTGIVHSLRIADRLV